MAFQKAATIQTEYFKIINLAIYWCCLICSINHDDHNIQPHHQWRASIIP